MASEAASDGLAADYDDLADRLPREVWVYRLGVQDVIVRQAEHGVDVYKRAGRTSDAAEVAAHDGPALINGSFRTVEERDHGVYQCYHPHGGRMGRLGDELQSFDAVLLSEVERVV